MSSPINKDVKCSPKFCIQYLEYFAAFSLAVCIISYTPGFSCIPLFFIQLILQRTHISYIYLCSGMQTGKLYCYILNFMQVSYLRVLFNDAILVRNVGSEIPNAVIASLK
jgi:hypothetical protein